MDEPNNQSTALRHDGYVNAITRYGTQRDSSTAYTYEAEPWVSDYELVSNYVGNGLFTKIIDTPADMAATGEFDLGIKDADINAYITDELENLKWVEKSADGLRWDRLFGGSIIVMLVDDGRLLHEPLNWDDIRGVDELIVFDRSVVQPDYFSTHDYLFEDEMFKRRRKSKFGMPEHYTVSSQYGQFTVHESRCLVFRNSSMPELSIDPNYRFWGVPEYIRIRQALREAVVAQSFSVKLLERSVQAIYKMQGLAAMLATDEGEQKLLKRLDALDLCKSILKSVAIDADGESYTYESLSLTGVKDVIDGTCNMLSAVTSIAQTTLFGRSPTGQNATGESDLEITYNLVGKIQRLKLKDNQQHLLDVLFRAALNTGRIKEEPNYKLNYLPLWNLSEKEQAEVDKVKADTAYTKAQTSLAYVDIGALSPSEVRRGLAQSEEYIVEDLLDSQDASLGWASTLAGDGVSPV